MKKKIVSGMVIGSVALLAAMGLAFLWWCPHLESAIRAMGPHWAFKRQMVWNVIGVAVCCGVAALGWKRLLKVAPLVFAGWIAMYFVAANFMPAVNGSLCLRFGPFVIHVLSCIPFVFALIFAWVAERFKFRAVPLLLCTSAMLVVATTVSIASTPGRVERIKTFLSGGTPDKAEPSSGALARIYCQRQQSAAFKTARWFGSGDAEALKFVPGRCTHSMPVASAVVFGKWFPAVVLALFAVFAAGLVLSWRSAPSESQKVFVFVGGLGIVMPAAQCFGECFNLVPMHFIDVPLVSFGGTQVLTAWLTAGTLLSRKPVE